MLRSVAARSKFAATRFIATDAPAGSPSTPQPPPPPPSGTGFLRRVLPLAFLGGTGYVLYKGGTDPDFRASLENHVPGSARFFDLLPAPAPAPSPNFVAQTNNKEANTQIEANRKEGATLPSSYKSVPDILLKIEEASPQVAKADGSPEQEKRDSQTSQLPKDRIAFDNLTPSQRAAEKVKNISMPTIPEAGDGPLRIPAKTAKPASKSEPNDVKAVRSEPEKPEKQKPTISEVEGITLVDEKEISTPQKPAAKGKLARILGKGDFQAEKVQRPDVVDDSDYQKPKFPGKTTIKTPAKKSEEGRRLSTEQKSKGETQSAANAVSSASLEELKALRAELQSQTKWEAVRLQEAVRSQMVEDKKEAAKEIAGISQKHAEELARVREDALEKANKVISERTRELKKTAEKQRDEEVGKLLKAKAEELRQSITLEFTNEQHQQVKKREEALANVNAQVAAMTSQFDAILMHAERAKEAAKRTSHAFLLRETIGSSRPLGSQLSKASDESELGRLVKESVPDSAIEKGVSSVDTLQSDFSRAARRGLSVAMVPDGKAGTIWGHLLGAIFSRLKIPIDTRVDSEVAPKCNEDRIRLAQQLVKEGDLEGAVSTLESLDGLSADVMADWIGAARARIAADLAADVLLADAIIAQVTFTRGNRTETVVA